MSFSDVVVAALATWQIVEIWHHGAFHLGPIDFPDWRSRVENWGYMGVRGWFADVLQCPWCLSVWVGLLVCAGLVLSNTLGTSWVALPVYAFAVSRLANLGNDLLHAWCRTPRIAYVETDAQTKES
jgi:Protein of unknown function (DUF1360)